MSQSCKLPVDDGSAFILLVLRNPVQFRDFPFTSGWPFHNFGMKKRVALARALVLNPKYLFCDEPNSGLDPQTSLVIDQLIKDLTQEHNITTVINTHDMNTVMEGGDNIIYMNQGVKEWEGSKEDIFYSDNELLNNFIFASKFFQDAKRQRITDNEEAKKKA